MAATEQSSRHWLRRLKLGDAAPNWGWIEAIAVGLLLGISAQIITALVFEDFELLGRDGPVGLLITQAIKLAGLIPILAFLYLNGERILRSLLLLRVKSRDLLLALQGVFVYVPLTFAALLIVAVFIPEGFEVEQELGVESGAVGLELATAFLILVVITPVLEEVVFRGFIFRGIARSTNVWIGVIISSLIFGFAHGQVVLVFDTFVMGAVCAVLVVRAGSLWPAIFLHALKNGLAFYMLFLEPLQ